MKINKSKHYEIPQINTSALPDIIFMLLFFFMVVTVIRKNEFHQVKLPELKNPQKIEKYDATNFLFISQAEGNAGAISIRINDKLVDLNDLGPALRKTKLLHPYSEIITILEADKHLKMSIIDQIKWILRKENFRKLEYKVKSTNI